MITLFIFKPNTVGIKYGIGTYLSQITDSIIRYPGVKIYFVNFYSIDHKEYTVVSGKRIFNIYIPTPILWNYNEKKNQKYAGRVVDLISGLIKNAKNVAFYINSPSVLPIVRQLKSRFSYPVVSIIHLARWQILSNGNKQKFIKVWENQKDFEYGVVRELNEEKEFYQLADKIVSVTNYMKEFVIKYYGIPGEKISVVRNGINGSDFYIPGKNEKNQIKKQLGFRTDEKIILFSGRLDSNKGLIFLLEAFKEVVKENENVRLVLIGEDSGTETICQFLSHCTNIWSKVTFTGFLKYEEVLKFYQIADVGIIPSIYDQCPYVALEMIACNIPLIISNTEGLNEILTANQCIYLNPLIDEKGVISFDKNEIATAILSLINDPGKAKFITKDYPELIRTRFSADRMAGDMLNILKSLIMVK